MAPPAATLPPSPLLSSSPLPSLASGVILGRTSPVHTISPYVYLKPSPTSPVPAGVNHIGCHPYKPVGARGTGGGRFRGHGHAADADRDKGDAVGVRAQMAMSVGMGMPPIQDRGHHPRGTSVKVAYIKWIDFASFDIQVVVQPENERVDPASWRPRGSTPLLQPLVRALSSSVPPSKSTP